MLAPGQVTFFTLIGRRRRAVMTARRTLMAPTITKRRPILFRSIPCVVNMFMVG